MFPLWEVAVAPALEAAEARTIVEIGALRGENTRLMIDRLGPQTVLHVIDPLPDFDPAIHEREFAGQYVFHRALSLDVLGDLPPMDAALVDGDHNWYTVFNELRLLREVARANDAPLPLLILHDVGWPYGRRDLYYDPETIPAEFRKEWARKGMEPDKKVLVPFGAGLNPTLANAMVEGGRRNGVRTGLDDFVASHDRPLRQIILPIYFGLAIVAEEERLARQPALAALFDHLESAEGRLELLELAEEIRIQGLLFQHKIFFDREAATARLARRYLHQVQAGPVGEVLGAEAAAALTEALDAVRADLVLGDVVAVGVDQPEAALFLAAYVDAWGMAGRRVWAYGHDTAAMAAGLARLGLDNGRTQVTALAAGASAAADALPEQISVLHVGPGCSDDDAPLLAALRDRLAHGAHVIEAAAPLAAAGEA